MKISCGTDIVSIERIKKAIERHGDKFLNNIYTEKEIQYCKSHDASKYQHFAARFAAKEAAFKATSKIIKDEKNVDWKNIEVLRKEDGKPDIFLNQVNTDKIQSIDISLSHSDEFAVATVVVLYDE